MDADAFDGGSEDADAFDGDQCMEIIKWRDEVVEPGGKEGRVVADEDNVLDAPWTQFGARLPWLWEYKRKERKIPKKEREKEKRRDFMTY